MSNVSTDRNLLFGLIAMQNGLITREHLMTATGLWLQDKSQPMDQLLVSQEFITQQQHGLLSELVNMHLDKHEGDAERSLAAVDAISSVREELREFGDEEVEKTLGHIDQEREWSRGDETVLWTPPEKGQRFRILRPHAKGGLGIVNVAHDAELNREVALKEIQERHADNPDSRTRFVQEAEITGGLEHPVIVPVYGLGTHDDNRPYYAMRLVRGDTFKDAIDRFHKQKNQGALDEGRRRLELRRLLAHFISLCNTIEYAHSRGILHRDIKPPNVMLGKYGETLVVDWGLAKTIDRKEEYRQIEEPTLHPMSSGSSTATQMGSAVGTPSYMSPEQAAGRLDRLSAASDVYSLGATLYYLLTGQPSLSESDAYSAIRKVQTGDFPPPRSVNTDIPKPLESICLKAMVLEPDQRYQSATSLSADIERVLADEPANAHSESLSERFTRLARRYRTWFRAGAAALFLTTVGAIAAMIFVNAARQDEADARREAQQLADKNAELVKEETSARHDAEEQLRRSYQVRLAAQAVTLQEKMPPRAILLALESIRSARENNEIPPRLALEVLHESPVSSRSSLFATTNSPLSEIVLSADGRWLAARGLSSPTRLWRLEAGASVPANPTAPAELPMSRDLDMSPDGRWLALGLYDGKINLYDLAATDPIGSVQQWTAHVARVELVFTPDSQRLVSASSDDEVCKIWNLQRPPGSDPEEIPQPFASVDVAVSPDGASLAICGAGESDV